MGIKNCDTGKMLMFGGCLEVRGSLYLWVNTTSMLTLRYAWWYAPSLLLYISECIIRRNNIHNGIKEPIRGYQISIPIKYWCLVGASKWEHLCIYELLSQACWHWDTHWWYVPTLLLCLSEGIVWRNNVHNDIKATTRGYQNCDTNQILMFGGCLQVRESLYIWVVIWAHTIVNHIDTREVFRMSIRFLHGIKTQMASKTKYHQTHILYWY